MMALCNLALFAAALSVTPAGAPASRATGDGSTTVLHAKTFEFPRQIAPVKVWTALSSTRNNQILVGLCRQNRSAYLMQFDDAAQQFVAAVSVDSAIHDKGQWKVTQGKIHSQLNELSDGWVYGGTHLSEDGQANDYPGGHWFRYDPRSHQMEDLGLAMAHEGLITVRADEPRGCLYAVTYPGAYLLRFDLGTRKTTILGKTSRDDQVTRCFFVLNSGDVFVNQVSSPARQPGGIYHLDVLSDDGRFELPPVYRKTADGYVEPVAGDGRYLYNYWLAGVTDPGRSVAYTTGFGSGHLMSLHLLGDRSLAIHDHGLTVSNGRLSSRHAPYSQGMCYFKDSVLFTVAVESAALPGKDQVLLLRYNPQLDQISTVGAVKDMEGLAVTECTAMACSPTGHLYLAGRVADREQVVLLRIELPDLDRPDRLTDSKSGN